MAAELNQLIEYMEQQSNLATRTIFAPAIKNFVKEHGDKLPESIGGLPAEGIVFERGVPVNSLDYIATQVYRQDHFAGFAIQGFLTTCIHASGQNPEIVFNKRVHEDITLTIPGENGDFFSYKIKTIDDIPWTNSQLTIQNILGVTRQLAKFTQVDVAQHFNVPQTNISRHEKSQLPSHGKLVQYLNLYKVDEKYQEIIETLYQKQKQKQKQQDKRR